MEISFIAHKINRSGGSSFSLDLMARSLANRGHTVRVITTNLFKENNVPENRPYDVIENVLKDRAKTFAIPGIYKILKEFESRTDIYHIFDPTYLAIAGVYSCNSTTPVVGRLNAYNGFCTNPGMMNDTCFRNCTLSKKIAHNSNNSLKNLAQLPQISYQHLSDKPTNYLNRIFALSPSIKEIYVANGVHNDLIEVIPNFYDPEFSATVKPKSNSNRFHLTFASRLRVEKGPDILLRALNHMDTNDIRVDVLGDGPLLNDLRNFTEKNGLDDSVTFHGWVDNEDVAGFLTRSDVFIHAGRWPEPFGRTILEAMQCNTPSVVSNIGAPPWIVDNAGVVFEQENAKDLADTLSKLNNNPERLEELKNNCSKRLSDFEPERLVSKIEDQYSRAVIK